MDKNETIEHYKKILYGMAFELPDYRLQQINILGVLGSNAKLPVEYIVLVQYLVGCCMELVEHAKHENERILNG